MVFTKRPKNFNPKFEVVCLHCEFDGKLLFLHRQDHKPEGNTWGMPAGKVEVGESPAASILREVAEELSLVLMEENLEFLMTVFVEFPTYEFIYHIFKYKFIELPEIKINLNEHKDSTWVTPEEALKLNLIEGEEECIRLTCF
jgi:8-oxo-dGTP pyrophosphatase MutT (NUDIX family)